MLSFVVNPSLEERTGPDGSQINWRECDRPIHVCRGLLLLCWCLHAVPLQPSSLSVK
jgi:hypothetical protein